MTRHVTRAARQRIRTRAERVIADFMAGHSIASISARRKMQHAHIKRLLAHHGYDPDNQAVEILTAENARLRAALAEREAA